jgi:hypothetical protein
MSDRERTHHRHDSEDSEELRRLFRELRSQEARAAPSFQDVMARARDELRQNREAPDSNLPGPSGERFRTVRSRLLAGGGLLAAAAVAALMLVGIPDATDRSFEEAVRSFSTNPALGAWRSPTQNLLRVPGMELLRTVPDIEDFTWPGRPEEFSRTHSL